MYNDTMVILSAFSLFTISMYNDTIRVRKAKENKTMTQKDLIKIASNDEAIYLLHKIQDIQSNMCYKTEFEQKTAMRRMRELAQEIINSLA